MDHIIFGHLFSPVGRDMKKMVEVINGPNLLNEIVFGGR